MISRWTNKILAPVMLVVLLMISGCSSVTNPEQGQVSQFFFLSQDSTVGQSFYSIYEGLAGFQVYADPVTPGTGEIVMRLRKDPGSSTDLAVSKIPVNAFNQPGYLTFSFNPQAGSQEQVYYALFEIVGDGEIHLHGGPGDAYLEGALYQNGVPAEDAQLAFQLTYGRRGFITSSITWLFEWSWILAVGFLLFVVPGMALSTFLLKDPQNLSWIEKFGISAGLSLAIYPVIILWTSLVGLRLGSLYAYLPIVFGLAALTLHAARRIQLKTQPAAFFRLHLPRPDITFSLPEAAFVVLAALIVFTRFWVVRAIDIPMFGDSYHHTLIARLMVDNGGLFNSWLPFSELSTLTYHFGFHSLIAVFHWITGYDLPQSTLYVGQLVNILAVLCLYPLAVKMGRSRWAGVVAVLAAGLLSPMPMYYTNWGRYTQLAGQVILPALFFLLLVLLSQKKNQIALILLSTLAFAGLALTHYRLLVYAVIFLAVLFLFNLKKHSIKNMLVKSTWIGVGAGVLFVPWFYHVFSGRLLTILGNQLTAPAQSAGSWVDDNSFSNLAYYFPPLLLILALMALAVGLWKRDIYPAIIGFWLFLVLLVTNPHWLNLPGSGALTNFALLIFIYFPASILLGAASAWLINAFALSSWLQKSSILRKTAASTLFLMIVVLGFWGAQQRLSDLRPEAYAMATQPDIRAAEWIKLNTNTDSHFLVNSFFAYGDSMIVGADAGWWLPLLANRTTTVPPMNYGSEVGPFPNFLSWINQLSREVAQKGISDPEVYSMLVDRGITHVYIGQRQGRVNNPGFILEPAELLASEYYEVVYHQDRVWVFQLK
jgi:hypothetical protein